MIAKEVTIGDVNGNPITFLTALLNKQEVIAYMQGKDVNEYDMDFHTPHIYGYNESRLCEDQLYFIYKLEDYSHPEFASNERYIIAEYCI